MDITNYRIAFMGKNTFIPVLSPTDMHLYPENTHKISCNSYEISVHQYLQTPLLHTAVNDN
jgi:hypothetical protein